MPRPTVIVDKDKLVKIIEKLESESTFTTQSALYQAVATAYGDNKVTPSVVMLRIKQFNIPIKTEKAKISADVFRERIKNSVSTGDDCIKPKAKQTVQQLLLYADSDEKKKYEKLAKAVLRGSRKAAIKLNCLSCANFQTTIVKECDIDTCPLWLFRPYQ